jgi:hypothetical protein
MVVPTVCATTSSLTFSTTYRTYHLTLPVSFSTPLVACPDYFPVQKPIKTYSKLSITTSKTFSSTQPAIPLGCVNENDCGAVLLQSAKQRNSLLKKLDFDS